MSELYYKTLKNAYTGYAGVTLQQLLDHLVTTYAAIDQFDLEKNQEKMTAGSAAGTRLVGITKMLGWMVLKMSGFMERTMTPVRTSPRLDLIETRFPLCSLCWSVMLARLGSPTILVGTGCGNTAKSWSALTGIGQT